MIYSKTKVWVVPLVVSLSIAILIYDIQSPLGSADYIFYFLPVILSVFHENKYFPYCLAVILTIFSYVGFTNSPASDALLELAVKNRVMAGTSIWLSAILVSQNILTRNKQDRANWIKNGLGELAQRLRGELTPQVIGQEVLNYLNIYTHMKVGAAYVRKGNEKALMYLSSYAHSEKETILSSQISFGTGLIGQCAVDKRIKEINPVPDNYLKVESSLGGTHPRAIIMIPLMADNHTVGVLETAYINDPTEEVREFLNSISELAGIALQSALHKESLAQLLSDAQQLTEELQSQQEELRVVNEELEQQSKALKDSHVRLENQQAELEQTNQQLEEQAQTMEHQASLLNASNKELTDSKNSLEKASQYKSEFLANMSHELRTPLNSSLILAKLLSENKPGNLNDEQIKYANVIYSSGNDLLNLINDILDLSKVEAGKLTVMPERVNLGHVSQTLKQTFEQVAVQKKIDFKVNIDPTVPKEIITDRLRLEQILKNLISNAIKFTEKGSVEVTISKNGHDIEYAVKDTGVGIKPDQQQIIFEAFRQADGTTNRKYGGTGLGLSISRELSKILGGHITIQSTHGEGSVFTLHLPEKFGTAKTTFEPNTPSFTHKETKISVQETELPTESFSFVDDRDNLPPKTKKILIIEDDEPFAKILFDLAHEMGFAALAAPTADEGLKLAKKYIPEAVLLDIRLPDHSGLMVLDQMKSDARTRHIPVHVISSTDFSKSAREMGAIGYDMKPVTRDTLSTVFQNITSLVSQKEKVVLVVEDDEVQKDHIVRLISDKDVKVEAVGTANEALEKLAKQTYDCMIMDLSLPDLSGHDLLQKLSNTDSPYSFPPVIVYTARDLTTEEEERLRQYSGSIIIKGAKSPERLLSEVTLFLHRVETDLPPERQKMLKELRSREKTLETRNILVVDDDVRNIFALTSTLENCGAIVTVARNGREALEKLDEHPGFDLVLMDIMMPEMDGYEAITRIRKQDRFNQLPVIALTAKTMKDDQVRCLNVGANDYLPKPLDVDKLLSLIRVWLPIKRSFIN